MRKLTFMLLILLAAIGCSKKEEDTPKPDPVVLPKYMEYTGVIEADQSVVVLKFDGYFKNADNTPDYDTPIYVSADKIYSFIVNNFHSFYFSIYCSFIHAITEFNSISISIY